MNRNQVISSIMTTNLIIAKPEDKVKDIQAIFEQNNFHHIPVVDQGNLVGIISLEDIRKLYYKINKSTTGKIWSEREYATLAADNIMTVFPIQLDPEDTIGLAADIFLANKFHALPIVDDGELVGIATIHDLLDYAFNSEVVEVREEALSY